MIAHLEVKTVTHFAFGGPVDRVLNLIGVDVVTGHLAARQRREVVGDSAASATHVQEMRFPGVGQIQLIQDMLLDQELVPVEPLGFV